MEYKYDITLSFAGEDRKYVAEVAEILKANSVKVFYDEFEKADLWGKDLGVHFDYVYRKAAKYCIPFISASYKEKVWTNHEIKTAISRMIETNDEYILPARFDDTEIEGIRPTIGFIDLRNYSPTELATLIMIKLGKEESIPVTQKEQDNTGNVYLSINAAIEEGVFETTVKTAIGINFTNTIKEDRYYNEPVFRLTNAFEGNADGLYFTDKLMPIQFPAKLEYGEVLSVAYIIRKGTLEDIWEKLPIDTEIYSIVTTTLGEKFESNRVNIERIIKSLKGK